MEDRITFCEHITQYDAYLYKYKKGVQYRTPLPTSVFYSNEIRKIGLHEERGLDKSLQLSTEKDFYENGQPSYKLFPAIADALVDTKIDIPTEELRLPYSSFVIRLSDNFRGIKRFWKGDL